MFPRVPQSSLGILRVRQLPPPLEHPSLKNPTICSTSASNKAKSVHRHPPQQCNTVLVVIYQHGLYLYGACFRTYSIYMLQICGTWYRYPFGKKEAHLLGFASVGWKACQNIFPKWWFCFVMNPMVEVVKHHQKNISKSTSIPFLGNTIYNHLLRMFSWNLKTMFFEGDYTPLAHI